MSDELAVDVRGLVKRFGSKVAVDGVDLQMPRGEVWGFLGPNGSGKTTTIRMICGLLRPTEGEGRCLGFDIGRESEAIKRRTGYMTQRFSFWEDMTIRENLEFVARLYGMSPVKEVVDKALADLGLEHRQGQVAAALSGGWKQRLALAAVTMHRPELLLLDEPTAGVDPQARRDFWDEIHSLATGGLTVLVSTHYMDEAERCDHIVYLAAGKVITQGTVAEIVSRSGLKTVKASGEGLRRLSEALREQPEVEQASFFGAALHLTGADEEGLFEAARRVAPEAGWASADPTLEDAFIALTARAGPDKRMVSP